MKKEVLYKLKKSAVTKAQNEMTRLYETDSVMELQGFEKCWEMLITEGLVEDDMHYMAQMTITKRNIESMRRHRAKI